MGKSKMSSLFSNWNERRGSFLSKQIINHSISKFNEERERWHREIVDRLIKKEEALEISRLQVNKLNNVLELKLRRKYYEISALKNKVLILAEELDAMKHNCNEMEKLKNILELKVRSKDQQIRILNEKLSHVTQSLPKVIDDKCHCSELVELSNFESFESEGKKIIVNKETFAESMHISENVRQIIDKCSEVNNLADNVSYVTQSAYINQTDKLQSLSIESSKKTKSMDNRKELENGKSMQRNAIVQNKVESVNVLKSSDLSQQVLFQEKFKFQNLKTSKFNKRDKTEVGNSHCFNRLHKIGNLRSKLLNKLKLLKRSSLYFGQTHFIATRMLKKKRFNCMEQPVKNIFEFYKHLQIQTGKQT